MKSITFSPAHPIVFICDYDNLDAEIPIHDEASLVCATNTCISVGTQPNVDGDVTITLATREPQSEEEPYTEVFSGVVEVPNGELAIVTSEDEKLLAIDVASTSAAVRVWVDNQVTPRRVWVIAHATRHLL
jgi:hypothetical protein